MGEWPHDEFAKKDPKPRWAMFVASHPVSVKDLNILA